MFENQQNVMSIDRVGRYYIISNTYLQTYKQR